MNKIGIAQFIGRQLSRLRAGQTYYSIVVSTISALSLVSIAFPSVGLILLIFLFPFILFGAYLIGLFMDKSNITSMDVVKTVEMQNRYLNTADNKNNDFRLLQMEVMCEWMISTQENKPVDPNILTKKYKKFQKKWKQPEKLKIKKPKKGEK